MILKMFIYSINCCSFGQEKLDLFQNLLGDYISPLHGEKNLQDDLFSGKYFSKKNNVQLIV